MAERQSNNGASFEQQVERFYRALLNNHQGMIERNFLAAGPDGEREIDIVLRSRIADLDLLTVIEGKDHKRPVSVTLIDSFSSKLSDVGANKGIMVARNGFFGKAIKKARRLGITVCTLDYAQNLHNDPASIIPVLVRRIELGQVRVTIALAPSSSERDLTIDLNSLICGKGLLDIIRLLPPIDILSNRSFNIDAATILEEDGLWIRNAKGDITKIKAAQISFEMSSKVYFGYSGDLPSTMFKRDEIDLNMTMLWDINEFTMVEKHLTAYDSIDQIPSMAKHIHLTAVLSPQSITSANIRAEYR